MPTTLNPNQRLVPQFYVTTPDNRTALFVDGYTCDDMREWHLMMAPIERSRVTSGPVLRMELAMTVLAHDSFTEHELDWPDLDGEDVLELTFLLGNVIRMCLGIPHVRRTRAAGFRKSVTEWWENPR